MDDTYTDDERRLLDRFFTGDCTAEEQHAVRAMFDRRVAAVRDVEAWRTAARRIDRDGDRHAAALDADALYVSLMSNADAGHHMSRRHVPGHGGASIGRRTRRPYRYTLGVAVALVAAVVVVLVTMVGRHRETDVPVSRVYTAAPGQRATITLADGSRAILGPATTLTVTNGPRAGIDVQVSGEALFTITHHVDAPFRVHTTNMMTRVLGTTFFVRQYRNDDVARVVVVEGRVALRGMRDSVAVGEDRVLTRGVVSVVDDSGHTRITPSVAIDDYLGWTTGKLVFRDTPVHEIAAELGRAYGVEIRVADSVMGSRALTWTVPISERSLSAVLGGLAEVLGAHVVRRGQQITLIPGPSASRPRFDINSSTSERQYGK